MKKKKKRLYFFLSVSEANQRKKDSEINNSNFNWHRFTNNELELNSSTQKKELDSGLWLKAKKMLIEQGSVCVYKN